MYFFGAPLFCDPQFEHALATTDAQTEEPDEKIQEPRHQAPHRKAERDTRRPI